MGPDFWNRVNVIASEEDAEVNKLSSSAMPFVEKAKRGGG